VGTTPPAVRRTWRRTREATWQHIGGLGRCVGSCVARPPAGNWLDIAQPQYRFPHGTTHLGIPIEVRKARFGWGPDSDDMTFLYFDRQMCLSPASCWVFGPSVAGHSPTGVLHAGSSRSSRARPQQAGMFMVMDRFRQVQMAHSYYIFLVVRGGACHDMRRRS
jgi:hypothetical protein